MFNVHRALGKADLADGKPAASAAAAVAAASPAKSSAAAAASPAKPRLDAERVFSYCNAAGKLQVCML